MDTAPSSWVGPVVWLFCLANKIFHAEMLFLQSLFRDQLTHCQFPLSLLEWVLPIWVELVSDNQPHVFVLDWCSLSLVKVCWWILWFLEHGISPQRADTERKWNYCFKLVWTLQLSYEEGSFLLFVIQCSNDAEPHKVVVMLKHALF